MYPGDGGRGELERELRASAYRLFPDPDAAGPRPFPRLGDGVHRQVDMVQSYASLTAISLDRAAYYGELLDRQIGMARADAQALIDRIGDGPDGVDEPDHQTRVRARTRLGLDGLIGSTFTAAVVANGRDDQTLERVETGEEIRALVRLEAEERDRAAKLLHQGVKLGIEMAQAEAMRAYGDTIALSLQQFCHQLGIDPNDDAVVRAARRAVYLARLAQGADEGDPDVKGGAPLVEAERADVLRRALTP